MKYRSCNLETCEGNRHINNRQIWLKPMFVLFQIGDYYREVYEPKDDDLFLEVGK